MAKKSFDDKKRENKEKKEKKDRFESLPRNEQKDEIKHLVYEAYRLQKEMDEKKERIKSLLDEAELYGFSKQMSKHVIGVRIEVDKTSTLMGGFDDLIEYEGR